jgi:hypothetical protein
LVTTVTTDPCHAILCGKGCVGRCGWSKKVRVGSIQGTCISGANTKFHEWTLGACSKTTITYTNSIVSTTTTPFEAIATPTPEHARSSR